MKTKLIPFVIAAALLSSCAGKLDIVKRKYNKGFYVSHSARKNVAINPEKTAAQHPTKNQPYTATETRAVQNVRYVKPVTEQKLNAPELTPPPTAASRLYADAKKASTTRQGGIASGVSTDLPAYQVKNLKQELRHELKKQKKAGISSDANTVVIAILCIFIPPLAVFLFQQKISIDFWVDLILTLLFWLPGIIFALLVCFGGVSLE